ncbi:MAG: DUF177 domain-containing protein [Chlorobi bacterium]|nr:DUF177 domain-containing protein [Chlorobiota bacterium]
MNNYKIEFRGLREDKHNYNFKITDDFFNKFEESEIKKGEVLINVEMNLSKDIIILNISLKGKVEIQCDRCLDYFYQPISYKTKLFVEFGYENSDISDVDNRITISEKEDKIVLDKHFYDYIHLSLPYQRFHANDKNGNSLCNIEMLDKLEELSTKKEEKETDPRWDKLKNLYN